MIKRLLYFLLLFAGIALYQSKNSEATTFTIPTNIAVTEITPTSAKISWSPIPSGQYLVEFRIQNGAWNGPVQTLNPYYVMNALTPCTTYEVRVRDAANPADVSNIVTFTTRLNYCSAGSISSSMMHIANVWVTPTGGGPQMMSNSGASNYTDYRDDPTRQIYLAPNSLLNTIFVSKGSSGQASAISAWIDFNGNGDFEPAERIIGTNLSLSATGLTSTFSVPASSSGPVCGVTLRVMVSDTLTTDACAIFANGEVEDYNVIFTEPVLAVEETGKDKDIHIYPNPVSDVINISGISADGFEIYNTLGQKIKEGKALGEKVNVQDLVKGTYFIQVKDKENTRRLKFIKK